MKKYWKGIVGFLAIAIIVYVVKVGVREQSRKPLNTREFSGLNMEISFSIFCSNFQLLYPGIYDMQIVYRYQCTFASIEIDPFISSYQRQYFCLNFSKFAIIYWANTRAENMNFLQQLSKSTAMKQGISGAFKQPLSLSHGKQISKLQNKK